MRHFEIASKIEKDIPPYIIELLIYLQYFTTIQIFQNLIKSDFTYLPV